MVAGIRKTANSRDISRIQKKRLHSDLDYLLKNKHRMRYHEYLSKGFPIASGVIEGACRHIVKDRMERSGMRWTIIGAQSMLNLRCIAANDDWNQFMALRIEAEVERIYPHRFMLGQIVWPFAA